jgi:hypothetical protein
MVIEMGGVDGGAQGYPQQEVVVLVRFQHVHTLHVEHVAQLSRSVICQQSIHMCLRKCPLTPYAAYHLLVVSTSRVNDDGGEE